VVGVLRKPVSKGWIQFAEKVVRRAGVVDDETAEVLIQAFAAVPRALFVAEAFTSRAMEDIPLPIGFGQMVPRPSTIARMLALLGLRRGMRVLEVGCGSGYTSAVMAAAGAQVFATEGAGLLAQRTRKLLDSLDYHNILVQRGEGRRGWPEHAPFDAVVASVPLEEIDAELVQQLVETGGRLIAPVGDARGQILTLLERNGEKVKTYQLEPCNFMES
jgi:protein-L-isoaspartate(D-aspartate) O-methyltransferase